MIIEVACATSYYSRKKYFQIVFKMLASRYELLEKIGNGAFGEVHRAKDLETGQVRAIKRLRVNDDGQLSVVPASQFQEIEAMRQLQHPNVRQWFIPLSR